MPEVALLLLVAASLLLQTPVQAPQRVFIERDVQADGSDRLDFVDTISGEVQSVQVNGQHYTVFGRAVMFYDPVTKRVRLVSADGRIRNHPFIQPLSDTRRLDWMVSADGRRVAWTTTTAQVDGQLLTTTTVANLDGSNPREVLVDGPRNGIRALPVAFSEDGQHLYMDYQPDGIADFTPFQQYAGLFEVAFEGGETRLLPGEPGCFCAAGLGAGLLLRLALARNLSGYDVVVTNLAAETSQRINALNLTNYTQAGDVLIAPSGTQAVYALAQIADFGGPNQNVQTVFVLVNLRNDTQAAPDRSDYDLCPARRVDRGRHGHHLHQRGSQPGRHLEGHTERWQVAEDRRRDLSGHAALRSPARFFLLQSPA